MTTYSQKPSEINRKWYVIDASEASLGRVATTVSKKLIGKEKATYTPHIDGGDYVVVINADKLIVTGRKTEQKMYYSHSGHPGALKETKLKEKLVDNPESVIQSAVKGMLPKNKLQNDRLARLKIYAGAEHEHSAQKPEKLGVN